mmetsp:Transcript_29447/g.32751  ORF Transcript_29447/g.32751 Transcript_29447/m.32751 type:complete len:1069 (+) Transcript_29447:44-3250(+)
MGNANNAENKIYFVATAHLDTQWLWTIQDTIACFLPDTVEKNVALMDRDNSDYVFSFEGAFRYMLIKEYYPELYEKMKQKIKTGEWRVSGGSIVASDVNVPSPEALTRQFLYGNGFFETEFGKTSKDVFLPDCFGFPHSLPTVAAHCGRLGFSSQKLTWNNRMSNFIPFDIGTWEGPDGSRLIACLQPGQYCNLQAIPEADFDGPIQNFRQIFPYRIRGPFSQTLQQKVKNLGVSMVYFGTGDAGGAPKRRSIENVEKSLTVTKPFSAVLSGSDEMFIDVSKKPDILAKMKNHKGELLMSTHGTGCYTSKTLLKKWNRQIELLASATEAIAVASMLKTNQYPQALITEAWIRLLVHQFHDDLTGTSMIPAYRFTLNDMALSFNLLHASIKHSFGQLTTHVTTNEEKNFFVTVFNPTSFSRSDYASIKIDIEGDYTVKGPNGIIESVASSENGACIVTFLATIPSMSIMHYTITPSSSVNDAKSLIEQSNEIENKRYKVVVNDNGNIISVFDKALDKELLRSPIVFQCLYNSDLDDEHRRNYPMWPEWEILPEDVETDPYLIIDQCENITKHESNLSVSLVVERKLSIKDKITTMKHTISLFKMGDAVSYVHVDNVIDWQCPDTLLKVAFPCTASNNLATYDLGCGTIQRGNNDFSIEEIPHYEVPAQLWVDLTDKKANFGSFISSDSKYGFDKPNDNTLRMTLIHSPNAKIRRNGFKQNSVFQDVGHNAFKFIIGGHKGDWKEGNVPRICQCFNQPLITHISKDCVLNETINIASLSTDRVVIRALKKAERSDKIVIRLQELYGETHSNVKVFVLDGVVEAVEMDGEEHEIKDITVSDETLEIQSIRPYQMLTFGLTIKSPDSEQEQDSATDLVIDLKKNINVVAPEGSFNDELWAFPKHKFPEEIKYLSFTFPITESDGCQGLSLDEKLDIKVPKGYKYLLFLAGSKDVDTTISVDVNGNCHDVNVLAIKDDLSYASYIEYIEPHPRVSEGYKRANIAWHSECLIHRGGKVPLVTRKKNYLSDGVMPYEFGYMFCHKICLKYNQENIVTLPKSQVIMFSAIATNKEL